MRTLLKLTCALACAGGLSSGCGEPVLGDYPTGDETSDVGSPESTCAEGDTLREVVTPPPGTVRIVEWMANPAGSDTSLEWVEVWFGAAADLNAVSLGPEVESAEPVVLGEACVPVDAGSWVVFGASPAAAPRVDAELPFSLANTGPRSIVASVGDELLDRVDYDGAVEGVSTQRDDADVVCDTASASTYDGFNVGTPGTANPPCERPLREGECFDDGVARAIDAPRRGDASIREWMPDPEAVENRDGEWVEVRFERAVDLNGLTLSDLTGSSTIENDECVSVAAGAHVVFAREGDSSLNGGIAVASYPLSISLNNRDETIELGVEGSVLDSVSYARSESGVAQQVDDDGRVCAATQPYGDGDLGTPGSPNPTCP